MPWGWLAELPLALALTGEWCSHGAASNREEHGLKGVCCMKVLSGCGAARRHDFRCGMERRCGVAGAWLCSGGGGAAVGYSRLKMMGVIAILSMGP